jgi:hypothetical protein
MQCVCANVQWVDIDAYDDTFTPASLPEYEQVRVDGAC